MRSARRRAALARAFFEVLREQVELAAIEQSVVPIDSGFGVLAVAAIAAQPAGPSRAVEAARWARRAPAVVVYPLLHSRRMSDDEVDATAQFCLAIEHERNWATPRASERVCA